MLKVLKIYLFLRKIILKHTIMGKPQKCISETEARKLHDNWVNSRANHIQQGRGTEDAREVVYSVEELEEYLAYVKSESAKQGINKPGIRIYFAAYDTPASDKATVFLAPTESGDVNSDNNYKIDSFNFGGGGWPPYNY